jgi:lactoylglutathione lyase
MTLEHVAIWADDLELLKTYYIKYFDGVANKKYTNLTKQFNSYFISFASGARLEIMSRPAIPANANDTVVTQHGGSFTWLLVWQQKRPLMKKPGYLQPLGIKY